MQHEPRNFLTKEEEIKMLRAFAKRLGDRNRSYCGEWLTDELPNLERAIKDDFPPEMYAKTYKEAEAIRAQMIADAKTEATRIKDEALRVYKDMVASATADRDRAISETQTMRTRIRDADEQLRLAFQTINQWGK
jgi:hypothetical protein